MHSTRFQSSGSVKVNKEGESAIADTIPFESG